MRSTGIGPAIRRLTGRPSSRENSGQDDHDLLGKSDRGELRLEGPENAEAGKAQIQEEADDVWRKRSPAETLPMPENDNHGQGKQRRPKDLVLVANRHGASQRLGIRALGVRTINSGETINANAHAASGSRNLSRTRDDWTLFCSRGCTAVFAISVLYRGSVLANRRRHVRVAMLAESRPHTRDGRRKVDQPPAMLRRQQKEASC